MRLNNVKYFSTVLLIVLLSILPVSNHLNADETKKKEKSMEQPVDNWLVLGPAEIPGIAKELLGGNKSILDFKHLEVTGLKPVAGVKVPWSGSRVLSWSVLEHREFTAYETGALYLATYLEPSRWMKTALNIHNTNLGVSAFLDGKPLKEKVGKDKITVALSLTKEKHLLILKVLLIKGEKFTFKASLESKEPFHEEKVAVSVTPKHKVKAENILNMIGAGGISVSPDGKLAAVRLSRTKKGSGDRERWMEILNTGNGSMVFSARGLGRIGNFKWMGNSSFSYTVTKKEMGSLFKYDLNSHQQTTVLEGIKNLSQYWWGPEQSFLLYSVYHKVAAADGYKYVKEIQNRAAGSEFKYEMILYYPFGGASHKISSQKEDYQDANISPDGKTILFYKNEPDSQNRPYHKNTLYLFSMEKMSVEKLFENHWINNYYWSPDSKKILFLGGASSFGGIGNTLPKGVIPNEFDTQAFIYDVASKKAEAISKAFDPSIGSANWSWSPHYIFFRATDKAENGVFKYSVKKKTYQRLKTNVDAVGSIGYAKKRGTAVYWGSSSTVPHKLYKLNLSSGRASLLKDYNREYVKDMVLGEVKDLNYRTPEGKTIYGRLYYPVGFDRTKKYPCIVYYYGGTSPVTRNFGGRYPKNWYVANGYMVYVLQPSGSIGFGQEFSAVHVNDWGKNTGADVIGATKELIKSHSYIDKDRVGAIGASYGGFLTQYLATQTDIFAAYISHAGITSLTGYWGVGDYGVWYNSVAATDSFPWNRKDIYIGHSPLFMADRINSPMLLLHGDVDNNVPPGESYQMFAALKLLGKEVALVTFKGQQHWIINYKKRLQWMRTIIAWWDKHLKKQPEHWKKMYE
ncbi:MAG: S9 family peptidase [bacterium]|nr:S9 family peptidase [bacterium]